MALNIEMLCLRDAVNHLGPMGSMPNLQRYRTSSQRAFLKNLKLLDKREPPTSEAEEDDAAGDTPARQREKIPQAPKPTSGAKISARRRSGLNVARRGGITYIPSPSRLSHGPVLDRMNNMVVRVIVAKGFTQYHLERSTYPSRSTRRRAGARSAHHQGQIRRRTRLRVAGSVLGLELTYPGTKSRRLWHEQAISKRSH